MGRRLTRNEFVAFLVLTGLISGVCTYTLMPYHEGDPGLFRGVVFGSFLAIALGTSGILDTRILYAHLKALGIIVASTAAYFCAYFAAFFVAGFLPRILLRASLHNASVRFLTEILFRASRYIAKGDEPAPIALFVGGLIGGFVMFSVVMCLCRSGMSTRARARRVLLGTILGGVLGVVGWALCSFVGVAISNLLHGLGLTPGGEFGPRAWLQDKYDYEETDRMHSLYVVWQTGVALAMGIMLSPAFVKGEDKPNDLHLRP